MINQSGHDRQYFLGEPELSGSLVSATMYSMRFSGRVLLRISFASLSLYFLVSLPPSLAQNPPADPAEISRDLLYLAPTQIQSDASGAVFSGPTFTYKFSATSGWTVTRKSDPSDPDDRDRKKKLSFSLGGADYALVGASDDDRATLELRHSGAVEPVVTAVLWNREQLAAAWFPVLRRQKKGLTAATLREDLEVGDPLLYAAEVTGDSVWVAVGHSTGEGELGLGTVVRFDVKAKQARVFQPAELATCAVTHLVISGPDSLLLGTRRQDGGVHRPCAGLVRFHTSTQQVEKFASSGFGSPLADSIITLLAGKDWLWVATDKGICSGAPDAAWNCWRIVPTVALKSAAQVTNKPGEKSGGELKPGEYEVLWANQNFLEIATKDSYDAWLAADDFAEAAARNFDTEPYKLLNVASGLSPIRPLAKPGGDPLEGALVYRAPLEKLPTPQGTPSGWVKIRARTGWIERGKLEVVPRLIPVEK